MKSPKAVFVQYLKDKGVRASSQRDHVLDVFLKTERHLTMADLYGTVRKKYPKIGYATVYRAMKVICDAGMAREVDFGDGMARFEHKYGHEHHDHLVCLKCGRFIEAVEPRIEKLQEGLARKHRFTAMSHKLQIFGFCEQCNEKKKKEER